MDFEYFLGSTNFIKEMTQDVQIIQHKKKIIYIRFFYKSYIFHWTFIKENQIFI